MVLGFLAFEFPTPPEGRQRLLRAAEKSWGFRLENLEAGNPRFITGNDWFAWTAGFLTAAPPRANAVPFGSAHPGKRFSLYDLRRSNFSANARRITPRLPIEFNRASAFSVSRSASFFDASSPINAG